MINAHITYPLESILVDQWMQHIFLQFHARAFQAVLLLVILHQQGLIPKGRLYVHLSSDAATATKVGSRHGKPVLYIVKTKEMYDDGYSFFLSKNGVWLTKEVPVKYLIKEEQ